MIWVNPRAEGEEICANLPPNYQRLVKLLPLLAEVSQNMLKCTSLHNPSFRALSNAGAYIVPRAGI